ncbi:MAG: hypothetical protein PW788_01695 [Micavibrio sp.]|nr:hypothetical protein [Micavibrio sp.]
MTPPKAPMPDKKTQDDTPPQTTAADASANLADLSVESLSRVFKQLTEEARKQREPLRPTLMRLNEIISKFQSIGTDQIGIEIATFDKMRDHNLLYQAKGADVASYCILSVYDARFLVRLYPEGKIDCYTENLNKPNDVQYPDAESFWYAVEKTASGSKINRAEPKFLQYNLNVPEDAAIFMAAVAQIGATLAAQEELRSFDLPPARDNAPLRKLPGAKPPKLS